MLHPDRALLLLLCFVLLVGAWPPFCLAQDQNPAKLPLQRLAVSFDLQAHLLRGTAFIDLPADSGLTVYLGDLRIEKITRNEEPLAVGPDATLLLPPRPLPQRVEITYQKQFPPGGGVNGGLVGEAGITLTGLWHPLPAEDILYELTAAVPAAFEAVAEADEVTVAATEKTKRFLFRFPHPLRAMHLVAGPYVVGKTPFGEQRELYTYFFPEDEGLAPHYREKTRGYLERYEELIGPFPFQRFSVVENRLPTGFAMPTFTLLGQVVVRLPFITETSLGHEVLHQWLGNSIEIDREQGNWAEGLTTYLADQAFAVDKGEGVEYRKGQLINYQSYIQPDNTMTPAEFMGVSGSQEVHDEDLRAIGYIKVSMLFHMLRRTICEEAFVAGLRDFYQKWQFRQAGWSELIASFEKASGRDLDWFFDQWLHRADVPELAVTKGDLQMENGRPVLSFMLRQENDKPYRLQVPVQLEMEDGSTVEQVIEVSEQETPVRLELNAMPRGLVIDPEYHLMRRLVSYEFPPVWSRFMGARQKLAIQVPGQEERFAPLLQVLQGLAVTVKGADEVTDAELANAAVLFLGPSRWVQSLFAEPRHPETGFTVDVRQNPLNPDQVAVLMSAASAEQAARGARKLSHYGKYSYLHFEDGRIQQKEIKESEMGQRYMVDSPPRGMALRQTLDFDSLLEELAPNRVVYAGETHTSAADHDLQLRLIRGLYEQSPEVAVGMEMFPREKQEVLDAYVAGEMDEWEFLKKSEYFNVWGFDYRLYRDIIQFARRHRLPLVALNIPRELVSKVSQEGGVAELTEEERAQLPAERNLDIPGYRERLAAIFRMHAQQQQDGQSTAEKFSGFLQAQALWDEAMAETVADYLTRHPQKRMVVVAGRGHVDKTSAIPPRVSRRLPEIKQAVVVSLAENGAQPDQADYVMFTFGPPLPPPPLLGVSLVEKDHKVKVTGFSPHGHAAKSGVQEGDILLAIDHEPIGSISDLKIAMLYKQRGQTVALRILRPREGQADERLQIRVPL